MKRQLAKSLVASVVAVIIACVQPAIAGEPYVIHSILPLTGPTSFLGKGEATALQVLETTVNAQGGVNGTPIHFEISDDQSSPQQAVQLASQLLARKVPVLIGPSTVGECNAIAPLLKSGPLLYCASPGIHPPAGSYIYTSYVSTADLLSATVRYIRLRGWKRLAVITSTDATGQDADNSIHKILARPENKDVQLVDSVHFNPADVTVSAQIEHVRASEPQAVIAWAVGAPMGALLRSIKQAGLTAPVAISGSNMTLAQMEQYKGFMPPQLYIGSSQWPSYGGGAALPAGSGQAHQQFFEAFKRANLKPEGPYTYVWDSAMLVIDALRKVGLNATAAQLREHIASLRGYAGLNGSYDFIRYPQRGLGEDAAIMAIWNPQKQSWEAVSGAGGKPLVSP